MQIWWGCQNYGPFLGTLNIRCCIVMGTQQGTIILTATHMANHEASPFHAKRDAVHLRCIRNSKSCKGGGGGGWSGNWVSLFGYHNKAYDVGPLLMEITV